MNKSKWSILFFGLPRLSLVDRYITAELVSVFWFSVSIFAIVGVAVGTLSDLSYKITEYGLPLIIAFQVFIFKFPEYISYALPMSVLLTTLTVYGRLNRNSELVALRSIGVSVYRFIVPALVLSLIVTAITFLFNEIVLPVANHQATLKQEKYIEPEIKPWQQAEIFYPEYITIPLKQTDKHEQVQILKRLIYATEYNGKNLQEITILNWSKSQLQQIIRAEEARWNKQQQVWDIFNGTVYHLSNQAESNLEHFAYRQLAISSAPFALASQKLDPYEMKIAQIWEYLQLLKPSGERKKILMFQVRLHQKIAFPFICLVFVLIGSTLGASSQTIGRAKSFGICVAIAFGYYLLGFTVGALGLINIISPFLAAWLPNFLGFSIGIWLLLKASK